MQRLVAAVILQLFFLSAYPQFATKGTGALRNEIWWVNWAGFPIQDGSTKTFTTPDGLTVTVKMSNVLDSDLFSNQMNTWPGAVLHLLYDFDDPAIHPALFSENSLRSPSFTLQITATRNGAPAAFTLIAADAEASTVDEVATLYTSGSSWQTIQLFRNSAQTVNPLSGCGTKTVSINNTYGNAAQTGQNPVIATTGTATNGVTIDLAIDRHGVWGGMAMAFGILATLDYGDLPMRFGNAFHQVAYSIGNPCNHLAPLPTIRPGNNLVLGAIPGDSDPGTTNDDNFVGYDEDAISVFPVYNGSGTYSLRLPLNNNSSGVAYLGAWFDANRNGSFEPAEGKQLLIPAGATEAVINWSGLPQFLPPGSEQGYAFRFRLASDQQEAFSSIGYATTGEVEDYYVLSEQLCSLEVQSIADTSICAGQPVKLSTIGAVSYSWKPAQTLSDPAVSDPIASPYVTTAYIVTGANPQACESKDTVTVSVRPSPRYSKTGDTAICEKDSVQLHIQSQDAIAYQWMAHSSLSDPNSNMPIAKPSQSIVYTFTVVGNNGCNAFDSVAVAVNIKPAIVPLTDTSICETSSFHLNPQVSNADRYSWSPSAGLSNPALRDPQASPSASTGYILTAYNTNGCYAIDTLHVNILALPLISHTQDTILCKGLPFTLEAGGALSYRWSPNDGSEGSNGPSLLIHPQKNINYILYSTGTNGCVAVDSIAIKLHKDPVFNTWTSRSVLCENDSVLLVASGGDTYKWTAGSSTLSENDTLVVKHLQAPVYEVLVTDNTCNVQRILSVPLSTASVPQITATKSNDIDCSHLTSVLEINEGYSYQWENLPPSQDPTLRLVTVNPTATTEYFVTASNAAGCTTRDTVKVNVELSAGTWQFPLASAFSPNNDGKNDCFGLKHWPAVQDLRLEVFNRWGQLVFVTNNPNWCWDGKYNGKLQPQGLYVYLVRANTICGSVSKKGTLLLVK